MEEQFNFERLVKDMVDNEIKRLKKIQMADKIKLLKNCKICKAVIYLKFSLNEQYLSPTFVKSNTNNPLANFKSSHSCAM